MSFGALARSIADEVEARVLPTSPVPIVIAAIDDAEPSGGETLGSAEGQSFIIEYIDSTGKSSTRRITVWSISAGAGGIPCLIAKCHERQAQRSFRVDRIKCFIDYDGEVFDDIPTFLSQNFGMSLSLAVKKDPNIEKRWAYILGRVKHDAVLLSALARVDGQTLVVETDAATNHLAWFAEMDGIMLEEAEILALNRYLNRLRPTEQAIMRAIYETSTRERRHVERMLMAAAAVIDADGTRHPREVALINAMATELIGTSII